MVCPNCNEHMNYVMHFETEKRNGFYQCPICFMCSSPKRLHLEEFSKIVDDHKAYNRSMVVTHKKSNKIIK